MAAPEFPLETTVGSLALTNPFLLASGPPTASGEQIRHAFRLGWAGAVTKTIVPDTMEILDVSPRFAAWKDEHSGLLGFENIELLSRKDESYWAAEIAAIRKEHPDRVLIASIMASPDPAEWQELACTVQDAGADAIELNVSCPHGMPERGVGAAIGQHADLVGEVTRAVRQVAAVPLIVKLTPNVTDILPVAHAAVDGGADILSAINTVQCLMGIDLETLEPQPAVAGSSTYGGYSGPAVKPIGLRMIAQIARELSIPLMGIGGISRWQDAAEYIAAGASVVQVCTAVMWEGAGIVREMDAGLSGYLAQKYFPDVGALRGRALSRIGTHASLSRSAHRRAAIGYPERCTSCGRCVTACRDGGYHAISIADRRAAIDLDRCDGCSLCSHVCPEGAIVMLPGL
ncbi:NAD-dependent dihydropyrimidine dehydrogenase subunit PreA [Methanoculleus sp. FWC-SCC1]|uniref:Dihydroorotate dehydrogenase B (NAD(+)), catalytic subunit n=1 Tax=Methanoculleus frigidifontis TaxID=2584085 RepID=A0ABT8MBP0_9EURY|nr:NAD-dependent dihydropyrimidine dehydrogenase subunit PreA [Methanoculleus sp. FWC-SCC1]MDN7025334.1 NAD-dependent dihydropyrimidine dehydrogenase subunit PreA [Methanoculleus sp. FWC-SCC1]